MVYLIGKKKYCSLVDVFYKMLDYSFIVLY